MTSPGDKLTITREQWDDLRQLAIDLTPASWVEEVKARFTAVLAAATITPAPRKPQVGDVYKWECFYGPNDVQWLTKIDGENSYWLCENCESLVENVGYHQDAEYITTTDSLAEFLRIAGDEG